MIIMARKGLPRKYAKMGFKKGWAAYKRTKTSPARRRKTTTRRVSRPMARRRSYRKVYRKARGGGGKFKPMIDGLLAGAGGQLASGFLGQYSMPAAAIGVGYFRNNSTLKTLGAYELGAMLASGGLGGFGGGGNGGGFN